MRVNTVKRRLKEGEASIGTWLGIPSAISARYVAQVGFDWLTVDLEHQPIGIETAAEMFAAIAMAGSCPLARVPWNTAENIKRVLDCGAWGIVVPMVNTRAEAEAAVAAAKYPRRGIRSVGGALHALNFQADPASYYARANDEILVVIQAESPQAVENADAILSVEGVDAVFIGPNDLLAQMGRPPRMETDDPEFVQALEHIRVTAAKYGVAAGIHTADYEAINRRLAEGFRFLALASDARLLVAQAREQLAHVHWRHADSTGEVLRY
ncbi:MAG: 2-dehydro-3-deoxyglucarate aldolase [Armatimonadetes bacterium]|nr:2-dehydro-3-deoxyglucarate aldolase [Armatimonadota bacterium]